MTITQRNMLKLKAKWYSHTSLTSMSSATQDYKGLSLWMQFASGHMPTGAKCQVMK